MKIYKISCKVTKKWYIFLFHANKKKLFVKKLLSTILLIYLIRISIHEKKICNHLEFLNEFVLFVFFFLNNLPFTKSWRYFGKKARSTRVRRITCCATSSWIFQSCIVSWSCLSYTHIFIIRITKYSYIIHILFFLAN